MNQETISRAEKIGHFQSTFFAAKREGKIVAYVRAELDGETFICDTPGYLHIKGAYCLPEHRGIRLNKNLLSLLIQKLDSQGYTRLGVDFESFNATAYGFWLKHFDAYTHSVVRRIDEHAITEGIIPERHMTDALHIAAATVNDLDVIVSYNFQHIVKRKTVTMTEVINLREGYKRIGIFSPTEVIESDE